LSRFLGKKNDKVLDKAEWEETKLFQPVRKDIESLMRFGTTITLEMRLLGPRVDLNGSGATLALIWLGIFQFRLILEFAAILENRIE
jgi:hypothetical protein